MANIDIVRDGKIGAAPGTLVYLGDREGSEVRLERIDYDSASLSERAVLPSEKAEPLCGDSCVTWLNVEGLHDVDVIKSIGDAHGIHPLTLEDVLHTRQRPKFEDYDDYAYITFKALADDPEGGLCVDQVSIVFAPGYLISFVEGGGEVFEPVRRRIRESRGRIRKLGSDYLAYALMDAVVDRYFPLLESMEDRIEDLEDEIYDDPDGGTLQKLHDVKRDLTTLRRAVAPLREAVAQLYRDEAEVISSEVEIFIRDLGDHVTRAVETIDGFREMTASLLDVYLSSVSNRMNEVMKVLTIIATIFIPLSFLAGVYGMNFKHMPELDKVWAYPAFWAVVILAIAGMAIFFRRKKWI